MGHLRTWKAFNELVNSDETTNELKISDDTTFDVLGYKTKEKYNEKDFEVIDNDIARKVDAITLALDSIDSKDYEVVVIKNDKGDVIKTFPEVK